jgi:hypothetical protein
LYEDGTCGSNILLLRIQAIKAKKRMRTVAERNESIENAPIEERCGIINACFSPGF